MPDGEQLELLPVAGEREVQAPPARFDPQAGRPVRFDPMTGRRLDSPARATFGRRFGAFGIDYGLMFAASLVPVGFGFVSGSDAAAYAIMMVLYLVVFPIYYAVSEGLCGGRTVGKALVGIAVVRRDGGPAGAGRVLGRELSRLAMVCTVFLFYVDHLFAVGSEVRTLHDRIAGTIVVERPVSVRGMRAARSILAAIMILTLASWVYDIVVTPAVWALGP